MDVNTDGRVHSQTDVMVPRSREAELVNFKRVGVRATYKWTRNVTIPKTTVRRKPFSLRNILPKSWGLKPKAEIPSKHPTGTWNNASVQTADAEPSVVFYRIAIPIDLAIDNKVKTNQYISIYI